MQWNPHQAALLAGRDCLLCQAFGVRPGAPLLLCDCVYRAVFRTCLAKFRQCAKTDPYRRLVTFDRNLRGVDRRLTWARRNEDYCADFHAAGRRVLPENLYRVFSFYHLLGAHWTLVRKRLGVPRSSLFACTAEVELRVGRELAHMVPYSLFPPHEYLRPTVPAAGTRNATPSPS